jgi:hypothetical protein
VTKGADSDLATATAISGTHTVNLPSFTPGAYTLKIYGTDATTPVKTVTVDSASDVGSYQLLGINNDAVKFEVSGLPEGAQALVNVSLQLEALNPYINKMDIVCESQPDADGKKLEISQPFTANDFSVSGGKFVFYIPTDYSETDLTFTFRDLFSQFGDVTYGGTGNARYSYVTSPYFETVDGYGDNGLYDSAYDPDHECTDKIYTSVAGNIRFKFNNAEELTGSGDDKTLEEYPFSVSKYLGGYEDPDGSGKTGEFKTSYLCQLMGYLTILDEKVRKPHENPSIGMVLCKSANREYVEFMIRDYSKPMGVATYKTADDMPEKFRKALPDIDALKKLMSESQDNKEDEE